MNRSVWIQHPQGDRRYERADLPLVLGGQDTDIPVPGLVNGARAAFFGLSGDAPFIQPADPAAAGVSVNGEPLLRSRWLVSGDVVQVGDQRIVCEMSPARIALAVVEGGEVTGGDRDTVPPAIMPGVDGGAGAEPAATLVTREPSEGRIAPTEFRADSTPATRRGLRLPVVSMAVFAGVAVLAAALWYMFTARPVLLQFDPAPDRVSIDGAPVQFELGDRYLLRPGAYTVTAQKAGYHDAVHELTVTRQEGQRHRFEMKLLPGLVSVDTGAVTGAAVTVDGQPVGTTPLADLPVQAGPREFTVTADGYLPVTQVLDVAGGEKAQALDLVLVPNEARLTLDSTPPADVLVDGEPAGQTPFDAMVAGGPREIALRLPGYKPWATRVEVVAGEPVALESVALEKADGMVSVRSTPSGAAVTVDGVFKGQTPLNLSLPPKKNHRLGFSRAGYEPAVRTVSVQPDEGASVSVSLVARVGEVRVTGTPVDAEVFVDGAPAGSLDQTLTLTGVPHRIEVRKPGFQTYAATVTPTPGFPLVVTATLATEVEAAVAAVPATATTRGGYELVRVAPGGFTMGTSRREAGRRANEVLRPVVLTRPYYIGARPVTNKQFAAFDGAHSSGNERGVRLDQPDHPVVNVTWDQAARYCNWLSAQESLAPAYEERDGAMMAVEPVTAGYRLPTEAEWAWAGRYAGGATDLRFPWGNSMPPASKSGNYADVSAGRLVAVFMGRYDDGFPATSPVGIFPANGLGLYDIGGNVAEWMHDYYAVNPATGSGPATDPTGPQDGAHRVVRGSSWMHGSAALMRLAYRDYADAARPDLGFRVARYTQ